MMSKDKDDRRVRVISKRHVENFRQAGLNLGVSAKALAASLLGLGRALSKNRGIAEQVRTPCHNKKAGDL